jgi:hypothetical protein
MRHLKKIVQAGDSPSSVYFWLYVYYVYEKLSVVETELRLREDDINVTVTENVSQRGGITLTVEWDNNYTRMDVPVTYLGVLAKEKYNHAFSEYTVHHHGILCVSDDVNFC